MRWFAISTTLLGLSGLVELQAVEPIPSGNDSETRKFALLVGVNRYDKRSYSDLSFAENDVLEMETLLRGSGFQTRLLLGSRTLTGAATLANIQESFDQILKQIRRDDLLIICLTGHGEQLELNGQKEPFFCPRDAASRKPDTLLNINSILAKLEEHDAGRHVVMVDACRNDPDPTRSRGVDGEKLRSLGKETTLFLSCSSGQRAYESPKIGTGHGLFFHHVIEGLRGKAMTSSGEVTMGKLASYVEDQMDSEFKTLFPNAPTEQRPHLLSNSTKLVLAKLQRVAPVAPASQKVTPLPISPRQTPIDAPPQQQVEPEREPQQMMKARSTWGFNLSDGSTLALVEIPGGTFQMGASPGDTRAKDDEKPVRALQLRDFSLGKHEVTVGQYRAFLKATNSTTDAEHNGETLTWLAPGFEQNDNHPVVGVSYNDALRFCQWLSPITEKNYGLYTTLPSEAQWEYACRAGSTTTYFFGRNSNDLPLYGNVSQSSYKATVTAISGRANPLGLHGMIGNVWEWCSDAHSSYDPAERNIDPVQTKSKVWWGYSIRGGSWKEGIDGYRSSGRNSSTLATNDIGFRIAVVTDRPKFTAPARIKSKQLDGSLAQQSDNGTGEGGTAVIMDGR